MNEATNACVERSKSDLDTVLNRLVAIRNRIHSALNHVYSQANRVYGVEPVDEPKGLPESPEPDGMVAEIAQVLGEIDRALDHLVSQQDRLDRLG